MRSTFHGLETAKRAIYAQQNALYTTGHNIANANTVGYTRQRVNFGTMNPIDPLAANRAVTPGQLGTGVIVRDVVRLRESFLDSQFRNENQRLGEWEVRLDTLEKLEAIMNEPSESSLAVIMDEFWAAWHTLSEGPGESTNRTVVIEKMKMLAEAFNVKAGQLNDLEADLQDSLDIKYEQANELIGHIANLNAEIVKIESTGDNANDLRDRRDLLVDELSKLVDVRVREEDDGSYTVTLANGTVLLASDGTTFNLEDVVADLAGGEIHGLIQSVTKVNDYRAELDTMVRTLVEGEVEVTLPVGTVIYDTDDVEGVDGDYQYGEPLQAPMTVTVKGVNGLHQLGYNASGERGEPLFVAVDDSGNMTASSIRVSPSLINDESLLAPSHKADDDGTIESSNGIALLMAKLKDADFEFGTTDSTITEGTIGDYYSAYTAKLGVETDSASKQLSNQLVVLNQVDMRRASVSAVSLDEEITQMIMFQHAYNAAARNMTAIDEMLDRIINGMGHVGR